MFWYFGYAETITNPYVNLDNRMSDKDDRVTMKIERALWLRIKELIKRNPEWGIVSVPDFVRRAIDSEINSRLGLASSREITLRLYPYGDQRREDER